jgi:CBS domain-containing protein
MTNKQTTDIASFLKTIPNFSDLPNSVIKKLSEIAQFIRLEANQLLQQASTVPMLYIIQDGSIRQNDALGHLHLSLTDSDFFVINLPSETVTSLFSITAEKTTLLYQFDYRLLMAEIVNYPTLLNKIGATITQQHNSAVEDPLVSSQSTHQYMRPCHHVMSSILLLVSERESIQSVAQKMRNIINVSCAFIVDQHQRLLGIITDKDITQRVVAEAIDVQQPISTVMTQHPYTVYAHEMVMEAVQLMTQYNIQHIPVVNNTHSVIGYITPKNLIENSGIKSIYLVEKIRHADSLQQLILLSQQRNNTFKEMMQSTASPSIVGQILTTIYDAFNYRLIDLAIKDLGEPPCEFSWIVAGSHARNEVHLSSDQDNAIIFSDEATKADRIYFKLLAMRVCKNLSELGYTLCKGQFMAATTKWCQSISKWKAYYQTWSQTPHYDSLLNLNVFIEIRVIYGNQDLFQQLNTYRLHQVSNNLPLSLALIKNAMRTRPPLGLFNQLIFERDTDNTKVLNIKKAAIGCINDIVRIYAVMNNCPEINTLSRINWLYESQKINKITYQDLLDTYQYVTQLRYQHQLLSVENNSPINNMLKLSLFGNFEHQHLKESFRTISSFQNLFKMKYIK